MIPALSCLEDDALEVFCLSADPSHDYALAREPTDCTNAAFTFTATASNMTSTATTTAPHPVDLLSPASTG